MSISPRTEDLRDAGLHFGKTPPTERKNGDALVTGRELWIDENGPVLRWWDGSNWVVPDASSASVLAQATLAPSWSWAVAIEAAASVLSGIEADATLSPSWSWAVAIEAAASVQEAVTAQATLAPSWSWAAAIEAAAEVLDVVSADATLAPSWSWAVAIDAAAEVTAASDLTSEQLADSPDFLYVASDVSGTTANDQTANGRDGTLTGGVGTADGFVFDGADDWIDSGYAPGTVGDCTWEMLVKIPADAVGSGHRWFGLVGQDGSYNQMYTTSGDGFPLFLWRKGSSGPEDLGSSAEAFDDDTWRLVTVTLESATGQVDIWVDGVFQSGKNRHTGPWAFGTTRIAIADVMLDDNTAGGFNFEGHLENFAFYKSVLSQARIEAHAEAAGFTIP